MGNYRAFGLHLESEIPLPALIPCQDGEGAPDVEITLGPVEKGGLADAADSGRFAQTKPGTLWMHVPGVARFLVTGGNRIRIDPEAGADERSLRIYVLGSCLGAIVLQRGQLILHGSALRFGDRAIVIAGHSGMGKSTLTAGLHLRGHELLSDDLAVLDGPGNVQPGFPQIKLWADTAEKLGLDTAAMARIRPQVDKFAYPVGRDFCARPIPLAAVYILHTHGKPEVRFDPIKGADKFAPIRDQTYNVRYVPGMGLQARHLQLCGQTANRIRLVRVTRPMEGFTLDELMEKVEADVKESRPALTIA